MKTIYKAAAITAALSISAAGYAAFFAGSRKTKTAEPAKMKGQMQAIKQAHAQKKGSLSLKRA